MCLSSLVIQKIRKNPLRGFGTVRPKQAVESSGWKGLLNTLQFSLAERRPPWYNPRLQSTESLNQGPAVFSKRLMYCRNAGWSAKPQGTGANVASASHWVIAWNVLLWDWRILCLEVNRNQNQRAYIWQRDQHAFEITGYSDGMDRVRSSNDPVEFGGDLQAD